MPWGGGGDGIAIVVWCGVYLCSNAELFLKISQYFGLVKFFVWFGLVFFCSCEHLLSFS